MAEFNSGGFSFTSVNGALYALSIIHIVALFAISIVGLNDVNLTILLSSVTLLLIVVPREAIVYKFITCFNYTNNSVIIARSTLAFVLVFLIFLASIRYLFTKADYSTSYKDSCIKITGFILTILTLATVLVLNILVLVNLKSELKSDISPSNIDIGFFSSSEIAQINLGQFSKDSNFNMRVIAKLSDIIYSENKQLAFSDCSSSCSGKSCSTYCEDYYLRTLIIQIACNSESRLVYGECKNTSLAHLNIVLKYLDGSGYPSYNCAANTNTSCSEGCSSLSLKYQLYLIQKNSNNVELAWKGLSNCAVIQPKVKLNEDKKINICSTGAKLSKNFFILYLSYLFFIFLI